MTTRTPGRAELLVEVEELQRKLEECEETLQAIRGGEVDAVVVSGPKGDQVFALQGAEQPYRIFLEKMNEGAVTLFPDGAIAYSNQRFSEIVKTPLERVIGSSLEPFVAPARRAGL